MKKTFEEFYSNGNLKSIETRNYLPKDHHHLYKNGVADSDGKQFIRVGTCAKYHENGQLNWELIYDDTGEIINSDSKEQPRKKIIKKQKS